MLIRNRHWILEAVSFCDQMARLGEQENEDAVCPDLNNSFHMVHHKIVVNKIICICLKRSLNFLGHILIVFD